MSGCDCYISGYICAVGYVAPCAVFLMTDWVVL